MISARVRVPRRQNTQRFRDAIQKSRDETAKLLIQQFRITTSTWRHSVLFEKRNKAFNKVEVFTSDKPYFYVNNGTRVRRALMSPDFVPKSRPRQLQQGAGRGGVVFVSRKVRQPGIKAREYDEVIANKVEPKMARILRRNLRSVT